MKLTLFQTFAIPLAMFVLTLAGLVVGLVYEDARDWIAIAALAVPILLIAHHVTRNRGGAR